MRLPLYKVLFCENTPDSLKLSLVSQPAMDKFFLKFNSEEKTFMFSIADEEKREIFGVALRPNYPILRKDIGFGDFLVMFDKETVAKIEAEFLKTRKFNLAHSVDTEAVEVLESFLINKKAGICPLAFSDVEDGSWILRAKIHDDNLWNDIKEGRFNGFSIETILAYSKVEFSKEISHKMNLHTLKLKLAKLLLKLGTAVAVKDEVEYTWEYDGAELTNGVEVFIEDENSDELIHPEDGEYVIGEETWEVRDGIVRKVTKETAEEVVEEPAEEVAAAEEEIVEEEVVEEPKPEDDLRTQIEAINARLDEIATVIDSFMELTTNINARLEELEAKLSKVALQRPEKLEKQEIIEKVDNPYACLKKNN